ncbi:MAG TPA: hypothetical protein VIG68_00375, partial [Lysobacter sp.]
SKPVSGAAVKFDAFKPNGSAVTLKTTTGSDGYARVSFVSGTGSSSIGTYRLVTTVTSGGKTTNAGATFTVGTTPTTSTTQPAAPAGLAGTTSSDRTSYAGGTTANLRANVTFDGKALGGAAVKFDAIKPNGTAVTLKTTTGSDGVARASFVTGTGASSTGNYTLRATITHNGRSTTAYSSFSVVN